MTTVSSIWTWRRGFKLRREDHVHGSWWEAVLGADEHGQWAAQPAGSPTLLRNGFSSFRMSDAIVRCYPATEWWVATFYGADRGVEFVDEDGTRRWSRNHNEIYVDVALPSVRRSDGVAFIDLTLDVVRRYDGVVEVLDEDEVDVEARLWGRTTAQRQRARHSCERVVAMVTERSSAFGGAAAEWRARFVGDCRNGRRGP